MVDYFKSVFKGDLNANMQESGVDKKVISREQNTKLEAEI